MIKLPSVVKSGFGLIAAVAVLANCSSGSEEPGGETREERVAEAMKTFESSIAKADETTGPGVPAMWTLADEDTTINLFGTVHILKPELEWRTETFNTALVTADKLVFEIDLHSPEGQQSAIRLLTAGTAKPGETLPEVLNEADLEIVKTAADTLGIPMASLDAMDPWFAAMTLSQVQFAKDGFDPTSGVEQVLVKEAAAQGADFGFLETIDDQIQVFEGLEQDTQIDFLVDGSLMLDQSGAMLDKLVAEWADGDVDGLGILAANPESAGDEAFYNALFKNRNEKWVPQIEAMLDEPGTVLIAVGAGHLAGPDSVITMLETKGHTLTRVQ